MVGTRTTNYELYKPLFDEEGWDDEVCENFDTIDTALHDNEVALAGKAPATHTHTESDITGLVADLAAKAPLASPGFTGTPTSTTPATADSTTKIATTANVDAKISAKIPAITAGDSYIWRYPIEGGRAFSDPYNLIDLGYLEAKYTIRHTGTHRFFALFKAGAGTIGITIYKNGSSSGLSATTTSTSTTVAYVDVACNQGDEITFHTYGNMTIYGVAIGIAAGCYY